MPRVSLLKALAVIVLIFTPFWPAIAQEATEEVTPEMAAAEAEQAAAEMAKDPKTTVRTLINLKHEINRCADFQERSTRLTCYDDISKGLGYMEELRLKKDAELIKKIGFWQVTETVSGFGERQINLRLESSNRIQSDKASLRHVYLVISCKPGKTDVFIDWKLPVVPTQRYTSAESNKVTVNYRVNDRDIVAEIWDLSADKYAFFSPDGVDFVRKIMNQKKIMFEVTNSLGKSEALDFDITGVEEAAQEIIKACYQTP